MRTTTHGTRKQKTTYKMQMQDKVARTEWEFLLANHLLHRYRLHHQVGTLHDQAFLLVLSGM